MAEWLRSHVDHGPSLLASRGRRDDFSPSFSVFDVKGIMARSHVDYGYIKYDPRLTCPALVGGSIVFQPCQAKKPRLRVRLMMYYMRAARAIHARYGNR